MEENNNKPSIENSISLETTNKNHEATTFPKYLSWKF